MGEAIRVLLVDSCPAIHLGLQAILQQMLDVVLVGEASDGWEALTLIETVMPALVLLDCQLRGTMSSLELAAMVRERGLRTNILALSTDADDECVQAMLGAGVVGILLKEEAPDKIMAAVRATAQGTASLSDALAVRIAAWAREEPRQGQRITEREGQVLTLLVKGKSDDSIAASLSIAKRTVRFHLRNIYDKSGTGSRMEAVLWAIKHHVVNME